MPDEENIFKYSLGCKGLLNDDIEVARGTVFREIRPGVGFKPAISFKRSWGGGTVDKLG